MIILKVNEETLLGPGEKGTSQRSRRNFSNTVTCGKVENKVNNKPLFWLGKFPVVSSRCLFIK